MLTYQIVLSHSRNRGRQRDFGGCKDIRITNPRPLQNLRCTKSARGKDYLPPRFDDPSRLILVDVGLEICTRPEGHPNSLLVLVVKDHALHVRLDKDVEVEELSTLELRMNIRMSGVLAFSIGADISLGTHRAVNRVQCVVVW